MPRKPNNSPLVLQYFSWRLFRRGGVYYADGRGGKYALGKHSLGTRDHAEAMERLRLLDQKKAIDLGLAKPDDFKPSTTLTISEGWRKYLDHAGRSQVLGGVTAGSLKRYRSAAEKHKTHCAKHGIETWDDFEKAQLEFYGNALSKKFAYRTTYFEITLLKSVNAWLIDEKRLPAECKLRYSLRKPQGTDTYCYTTAEVTAMLAHCRRSPTMAWLGHVILALAHTGLRISELAGMRWSDIDLGTGMLRVADERASRRKQLAGTARTTKGRRSREIPIHPRLRELLDQLDHRGDGRVFHAQRGGILLPRVVLASFINHVIESLKGKFPTPKGEIGFEHGRLHSFRHFFCSQALLNGASEGEVKDWLGHADSRMVDHYRHLRREDAARRMNQINFLPAGDERPPGDAA